MEGALMSSESLSWDHSQDLPIADNFTFPCLLSWIVAIFLFIWPIERLWDPSLRREVVRAAYFSLKQFSLQPARQTSAEMGSIQVEVELNWSWMIVMWKATLSIEIKPCEFLALFSMPGIKAWWNHVTSACKSMVGRGSKNWKGQVIDVRFEIFQLCFFLLLLFLFSTTQCQISKFKFKLKTKSKWTGTE